MIKQVRIPNMIEKRMKGGEKWYEKNKGKNTQCAKASELSTCQINCVDLCFKNVSHILGIERKLFQVFQLLPSKRKGLKHFRFGSSALFTNPTAAYEM